MSRTITEIYDALCVSKASMQELHDFVVEGKQGMILDNSAQLKIDLRSGSKVSVWRLWLWIIAVASWAVEQLFDAHKSEVSAMIANTKPHTLAWYASESLKYQHGYAPVRVDDVYQYDLIDENARLIKYAAAVEGRGKVTLKVAKNVDNQMTPLTVQEKSMFISFWNKWKDAGTRLEIISQSADILKINIEMVRDRLVLNSDNTLVRDNTINPVTNAINSFCANLEFDSILKLSRLVDVIQQAEGVVDVKLHSAHVKPAAGVYSEINMSAISNSGYFTLSIEDSTFTYHDNVSVEVLPI